MVCVGWCELRCYGNNPLTLTLILKPDKKQLSQQTLGNTIPSGVVFTFFSSGNLVKATLLWEAYLHVYAGFSSKDYIMATSKTAPATATAPAKKVGWFGLLFGQAKELVPAAGNTAVTSLKLVNSGLNTALNHTLGMELDSLEDLADNISSYQASLQARGLTHEQVLDMKNGLLKIG